jgi:hypothetical protein
VEEVQQILSSLRSITHAPEGPTWPLPLSELDEVHEQLADTITSGLSPESALKFRGLMDGWKKDFIRTPPALDPCVVWWEVLTLLSYHQE